MDIMADNQSCNNYTDTGFSIIYTTKLVVSSLAVVACLLAILLIVLGKSYRRFVYRLVLYFMIAVLLQALSLIAEQIPIEKLPNHTVEVREGWDAACSAIAFFDQVSLWLGNIVILWIFLYLIRLAWRLYRLKTPQTNPDSQKVSGAEIAGLFVMFFVPISFNWIPFALNMYGLSGLWCWLKMTENGCSGDPTLGLTLIFLTFYAPLMFLMLFGFVSLVVIVATLCSHWNKVEGLVKKQYTRGIQEIALVMIYPILYNLICILLVTNRIDSAIRSSRGEEPFYPLWLAHALADSFRTLLPPLAFLLHPSTWGTLKRAYQPKEEDTEYFYVPPEDSDISEGFTVRETKRVNYGSIL